MIFVIEDILRALHDQRFAIAIHYRATRRPLAWALDAVKCAELPEKLVSRAVTQPFRGEVPGA